MTTLTQIEAATRIFAYDRRQLTDLVTDLNDQIERLKRSRMATIKRHVAITAQSHAVLSALVEGAPALFARPRTVVFHGIKVGLEKGKGKIDWDDDERVVKLIKKHFADQADVLIKTTEKPLKKPLAQLSVDDLKRIGCTVETTGDTVVIRPTDTAVDKIVSALLADATEQTEVQEAA